MQCSHVVSLCAVILLLNNCLPPEQPAGQQGSTLADPPNEMNRRSNLLLPHDASQPAQQKQPNDRMAAADAVAKAGSCGGSGGLISIMPVGIGDCRAVVGGASLGVAPIFRKPTPIGDCVIEVTCPNKAKFKTTRHMVAGVEESLIIKPEDWR